jgi:regulator of protease activity HflC (stomatin/prohibitin superfamily)
MIQEKTLLPKSGYLQLLVSLVLLVGAIFCFVQQKHNPGNLYWLPGLLLTVAWLLHLPGFLIVNPNESMVMVLFGTYKGTVKEFGFFWANPFYTKKKVSLRAMNQNGEKLKVNDKVGNPIEIAAVLVWQVADTSKASFAVDNYVKYVETQSEAAVRSLAGTYPYDEFELEGAEITLRGNAPLVNEELEKQLSERLERAGVEVIEARISHLAYAPEIAGAMLQRQQASAVVAARHKIVEGAVGMVEMALEQLSQKQVVELDEERKAAMVSNLLVVLCSDRAASPVVNAGSLYH